ncbi:hypothetical protein Droror1_Dr00023071 [Drosera rotundifolia]
MTMSEEEAVRFLNRFGFLVAAVFGVLLLVLIFFIIAAKRNWRFKLPIVKLSNIKRQSPGNNGGDQQQECAICLREFLSSEKVRLLPRCGHFFHPACVDSWLESHPTCPVCRAGVERATENRDSRDVGVAA